MAVFDYDSIVRFAMDRLGAAPSDDSASLSDFALSNLSGGGGTSFLDYVFSNVSQPSLADTIPWLYGSTGGGDALNSFLGQSWLFGHRPTASVLAKLRLKELEEKEQAEGKTSSGGGKGGFDAKPQATAESIPSSGMAEDITLDDIGHIARAVGLGEEGARVAMAVASLENGLRGAIGDIGIGGSYGPYQFYRYGMLPAYARFLGVDIDTAAEYARTHPRHAAEWALRNYLGETIRRGLELGLTGPALAVYAQRYGQRSKNPEKAGDVYRQLFGG